MRLLARNRQRIYYRNLIGSTPLTETDEYGNVLQTGEYVKTYSPLQTVKCYVKSAIGMNEAEPFGDFTSKRRTIYIDKNIAEINEYSQLWIGVDPQADEDGNPTVPHNFTVDGISNGLNHIRIAIRKVEVNVETS
jgi:hypothetical protein